MILIDGYEVDVAVSEGHSFDSEVTEEPVESGATMTDHIANNPDEVTIEGVVTDSPIGAMIERRGDLVDVVNSFGEVVERRWANPPSSDAWEWMLAIRKRRQPVTIVTTRMTYESMGLTSLRVVDDQQTGLALRFTATFRHIKVVVNVRTSVTTAEARAQKKRNLGNKPSPQVLSSKSLPPKVGPVIDTSRPPIRAGTASGAAGMSTTGGRTYGPPAPQKYGPPAPLPGRVTMCRFDDPPPATQSPDFFSGGGFGGGGGGRSF